MESIRQYIFSVICIAVGCGILQQMLPNSAATHLVKMISGMVIAIAVLSPLIKEDVFRWEFNFERMITENSDITLDGQRTSLESVKQRIKENTEAYILTKAADLGANITVDITLTEDYPNVPDAVTITGDLSPYVRKQLESCLADELGIYEENQIWIS